MLNWCLWGFQVVSLLDQYKPFLGGPLIAARQQHLQQQGALWGGFQMHRRCRVKHCNHFIIAMLTAEQCQPSLGALRNCPGCRSRDGVCGEKESTVTVDHPHRRRFVYHTCCLNLSICRTPLFSRRGRRRKSLSAPFAGTGKVGEKVLFIAQHGHIALLAACQSRQDEDGLH